MEIPEERRLVINPTTQPTLETRPSRMNEVNSDFADRSQFHQAHTVQGCQLMHQKRKDHDFRPVLPDGKI